MAIRFLLAAFLLLAGNGVAQAVDKAALRDRCLKAIAASGQAADASKFTETATPIGNNSFLFQFAAADGNFFCQISDDMNPELDFGAMGLILNFRGATGEARQLPAELDKKCLYYLQKEVGDHTNPLDVRHDLVERTKVTPAHTDARWVYQMQLDDQSYRCVVRKSDGNFRVEHQEGAEWRALAAGILY